MTRLRTHLILGRVSNLPTVWANTLCAWIIVGGYDHFQLASFLLGSSLLYVGGMYLNDYCDREFDHVHCTQRPIPAGDISAATVLAFAVGLLAAGLACFAWMGLRTALYAAGLTTAIVVYDFFHKNNPIAPVFMGACRALIFLSVASAFENGIDTYNLIAAGTVFCYVMGVTYFAKSESTTNAIDYPAIAMMAAPALGAFYFRAGDFDPLRAAMLAMIVGWVAVSALRARVEGRFIVGKMIGPLLAALPLLDLLILVTLGLAHREHLFTFAALFALTTAFQRSIPAS